MDRLPPQVWFVDFEFSGTSEGERPTPICCVAHERHSGQTHRLWEDALTTCPYATGPDSLLVAHGAAAEIGCHLALGWPLPVNVFDTYAEYRVYTNTAPTKGGKPPLANLIDAAASFEISSSVDKLTKKRLQERCARGPPWEPGEPEEILAYNEADLGLLLALFEKLLPHTNLTHALERGRFCKAVARMEAIGVPIDVAKYNEVIKKRTLVIAKLIEPVDRAFNVYAGVTFKLDRFAAYLARESISDWPTTPSGRLVLKAGELEKTLAQHPQVQPLFDLRGQLGKLRKCALKIGHDGFARTGLIPFVAATGRSQPSGNEFIFAQPAWMRFLIVSPPGYAVASLDWSGQEIAIAAALSGDQNLLDVYASGDAHLAAGKLFGIIPPDGTADTHAAERNMLKPVMFGSNYGAGERKLAQLAKISIGEARELRRQHRRKFATFWTWIERVQRTAYREGRIETGFGWTMRVPRETRETTLLDWPMQATGNEMMRLAACEAIEAGINLCCTVHDAFVLIAPVVEIEAAVDQMREIMNAASHKIIGLACDVHADIFAHPKRFFEKKGAKIQAVVEACLAELEGVEPPPPKPKRPKRAMKLGDGETLHPYVAKVISNAEARIKTDEDPQYCPALCARERRERGELGVDGHPDPAVRRAVGAPRAAGQERGIRVHAPSLLPSDDSAFAAPHSIFNVQRHLSSARTHRAFRASAMQTWHEVVAAALLYLATYYNCSIRACCVFDLLTLIEPLPAAEKRVRVV
jgi:DNA polymerase-1